MLPEQDATESDFRIVSAGWQRSNGNGASGQGPDNVADSADDLRIKTFKHVSHSLVNEFLSLTRLHTRGLFPCSNRGECRHEFAKSGQAKRQEIRVQDLDIARHPDELALFQ